MADRPTEELLSRAATMAQGLSSHLREGGALDHSECDPGKPCRAFETAMVAGLMLAGMVKPPSLPREEFMALCAVIFDELDAIQKRIIGDMVVSKILIAILGGRGG